MDLIFTDEVHMMKELRKELAEARKAGLHNVTISGELFERLLDKADRPHD